jgi:exodeoxyribonuclease VII large subunit
MQLPLFLPPSWTVSELNRYLRELLESDGNLQDLWVTGEVANVSRPSSGHLYFTLKDSAATVRCVMWRNAAARLPVLPHEGEAVEVHGAISVFEAGGQYQLYADTIRPAGEGLLFQEFLRLKARLESEGLFDPARKRPVPALPQRIGIVTSATGAALRDILNTIQRRYPLPSIILAPTAVQGDEAPAGICAALDRLVQRAAPDVVILARGGGSIEDLWAFNNERVARAVAACTVPVITGVGHETDFTIVDFVSDLRAPTPTAAAELATPDRLDLLAELSALRQRLGQAVQDDLNEQRWAWNRLENRLRQQSPLARVRSDRQRLDGLGRRAAVALSHDQQLQRARLAGLQQRLAALDPRSVLARGYAVVTAADGRPVRSVYQVREAEPLDVQVSDGRFGVRVTSLPPAQPAAKKPRGESRRKGAGLAGADINPG